MARNEADHIKQQKHKRIQRKGEFWRRVLVQTIPAPTNSMAKIPHGFCHPQIGGRYKTIKRIFLETYSPNAYIVRSVSTYMLKAGSEMWIYYCRWIFSGFYWNCELSLICDCYIHANLTIYWKYCYNSGLSLNSLDKCDSCFSN